MQFTQVPPEQWPDKSTVKKCMQCGKSFGLFRTGSHCRGCGQVFCTNTCLPYRFTLPVKQSETGKLSYSGEPVPVCASCAEKLFRMQEAHKEKKECSGNSDISAAKNYNKNNDEKESVQIVKSDNNNKRNEELNDQLNTMQELLSTQKAASDILINESTTLRSENALVLERLKEMEQQLLQKKEQYEQLEHQLEKEKVEKVQIVTAKVEEEKQKLRKMLEQRHEEQLQTMEREVKGNTEQLLLEQRLKFEESNQTRLQNFLNILEMDVNDVHSIVIEERNAFVQLVKAMMSEIIVVVETNVTTQVKEQEKEIKEKALKELHEQLDKEWALKEQQLLKEQMEHYDNVRVAEMNTIKLQTEKELAECESKHSAEINALQKQLEEELEARLQEERALHVKESNELRDKYEEIMSKEQNAKAQEHLLKGKQSELELSNTEMQARLSTQTDEHNNFVELLLSYAQAMERKYFDNEASHHREVDEMKDEFDVQFLEQHVNIIENYKSKLSKVEEEHKEEVSRLREQLYIAQSTNAQLQQEKNINYNESEIFMGSNKTNTSNDSDEKILHNYESLLAHIQVFNKIDYNVMQPLHTQSSEEHENKLNSAIDARFTMEREKKEFEQEKQHQHQHLQEQKIEAENRERKRLALQLARSAQEITELSKANTELRSKLEKSEARVKALSTRLPLPQKTPIKQINNSEQPTPSQLHKSEIKNRSINDDGNNTNMHESNDVALNIVEDNKNIISKQIVMLQEKEKA